jgi:hypothetical protein
MAGVQPFWSDGAMSRIGKMCPFFMFSWVEMEVPPKVFSTIIFHHSQVPNITFSDMIDFGSRGP